MHVLPRSSRLRLPRLPVPIKVAPSLQSHYGTFRTTTSHSVPVRRIGTQALVVLPLARLPSHQHDRFPRSPQEPGLRSRRLYAGCRPGSKQVAPGLVPEQRPRPGFDIVLGLYDTSSAVHLRSTPQSIPDRVIAPPFPTCLPPRLLNAAAVGGLKPPPARRLRRAILHLLCSPAARRACALLCAFVAHDPPEPDENLASSKIRSPVLHPPTAAWHDPRATARLIRRIPRYQRRTNRFLPHRANQRSLVVGHSRRVRLFWHRRQSSDHEHVGGRYHIRL